MSHPVQAGLPCGEKSPAKRIGVFGGSFDPPHNAHVALARAVIAEARLDALHVVPTGQAWHKSRELSPPEHRLAMTRLAFEGIAQVVVDDRELRRDGPSYTIDTLLALQAEQPGVQLILVLGADQFAAFRQWQRWQDVAALAIIYVAARAHPDWPGGTSDAGAEFENRVFALALPNMPVSATGLRRIAASGGDISSQVPHAVARYISLHTLYQSPTTSTAFPSRKAQPCMTTPSVKTLASDKKDVQKLQRAIVDGLEDVKAQDIVVFDTEHVTALFERVIIASGTSNRQTKALAASVRDAVRDAGFGKPRIEGEENGEWIIVDCGAAVAHIMQPTIRQYYHLEELWGDKPVKLKLGATAPAARKVVQAEPAIKATPAARKKPGVKAAGKLPGKPTGTATSAKRAAASSSPPDSSYIGRVGKTNDWTAKRNATQTAEEPPVAVKPARKSAAPAARPVSTRAPAKAPAKSPAKKPPIKVIGKPAIRKVAAKKTAAKKPSVKSPARKTPAAGR